MASLNFNPTLSTKQLLWLIPIILSIHNLEEALTMPQWMSAHLPMLQEKIPLLNHLQFSTNQIYISLVSVTAIPFLVTFFCTRGEFSQRKILVPLTLQAIIFWNALMPHISGVFVLGMYNPGVVTAVVCNVPFSVYLYKRVKREGIVSKSALRNCILIGLAAYLPVVYLNHIIAQTISLFM